MSDKAEVDIKLKADDAASKVADDIRGKFDSLSDATDKLKTSLGNIATNAITSSLSQLMTKGMSGVASQFKNMVTSALGLEEHMRAVGSYFVTGPGMEWEAAMARSQAIESSLYDYSIAIGQNIEDSRVAFKNLAMQSDGTAEGLDKALDTTEKLMMFADITGATMVDISNEWGMMERGMVRTRGNLFKMMFSTGIFGKNLKTASTYWSELSDEQRTKALTGAMGKIYDKFAEAPQSSASLISSFDGIRQRLMDIVGMNLIGVLTPQLETLFNHIEDRRPKLEAIASRVGKLIGSHLQTATEWVGEKLTYFEDNWESIVEKIGEGAKEVYKAVKFIVANKELILMAYGLNVMSPSIQAGIVAAKALKPMTLGMTTLSFTSIPAFIASLKAATLSAYASAKKFALVGGSVVAAGAAAYAAIDQYKKLEDQGGFTQAWQEVRYGEGMYYSAADTAGVSKTLSQMQTEGSMTQMAQVIADKQESLELMKGKAAIKWGENAPDHYSAMGIKAMEDMLARYSKALPTSAAIAMAETIKSQEVLIASYNNAVKVGDNAMADYFANLAAKSRELAYGLNDSSLVIEGGFEAFMNRLGSVTKESVEKLNAEYAQQFPQKVKPSEVEAKQPELNLNGGQTFNIKQEFREADPDRIALFFRRDLVRAATSRTRSRVRTPFGA